MIPVSDIMSELMYVKKPEVKKKEIPLDTITTTHSTLMLTIVIIVGLSTLIGIGFAYLGYTSGTFSEAYVSCKKDVLSQAQIGIYQSADEITAVLKSCNGVTS